MWLFVWEEAVVAIEECSLPVVTSDRTLNRASHLFFGLYVGVHQKKLPDSAPSTLISGTIAYRGDRTYQVRPSPKHTWESAIRSLGYRPLSSCFLRVVARQAARISFPAPLEIG